MKTLFQNARIVCPTGIEKGNLLIDGPSIVDINVGSGITADRVVDVGGKYLIPGVIDDQVHFRNVLRSSRCFA